MSHLSRSLPFLALLAFSVSGWAQPAPPAQPFAFWPGITYDPAVPTMAKVLGYEPATRIASHHEINQYFEALAAAVPGKMKVFDYGKSWENRRLIYAAIGSDANLRRLPEIKATIARVSDPRKTSEAEAKRLMANLPAVLWLGYSVHGNELSGPEASMLTAYHLLAARNHPLVEKVLANVIVLIDPVQNPDGRTRFVNHFESTVGLEPDDFPSSAEHIEPWPGGRSNHYHFDMNRDWFALTQPETRARIKMMREWQPLVAADLHEMGAENNFYFAPEAIPFNPHLTKEQKTNLDWFGKNNAKYFDQFGFPYFTREVYDAFYPGYGASWPAYFGTIAMTYENAGLRGLAYRHNDGSRETFQQSVRKHFVASLATCEATADYRTGLLENWYNYRKTAVEEGRNEPTKAYILPRRGDVSAVDKLAALLAEQGVEVQRAKAPFQSYPAGSYIIPMAQPAKRFIRNMLDKQVNMEPEFLKEQERRRKKKLGDEIYDATAWSLPLQYNVECLPSSTPVSADVEPFQGDLPKPPAPAKAQVAYFVPWGSQAAGRFLAAALKADLRVLQLDKPFVQNGRSYGRGTLVLPVKQNPDNLHDVVLRIQGQAEVVAADSGWVDSGINFGSRNANLIPKPKVAMLWDQPVSSLSSGAARFILERQYGYPVTLLRGRSFGTADLTKLDVLILPDVQGDYGTVLGAGGIRKLKDWVAAGGTVVAIDGGVNFLADSRVGLLSTSQENLARGKDEKKPDAAKPENGRVPGKLFESEADYDKAIQAETESPDAVQGVLALAKVDPDHWVTAGLPSTVNAMVSGRAIFAPLKLNAGVNAAVYTGPNDLLLSGYIWEENRKQLAFKPLVMVQEEGRGNVIAFTADPNFRGYLDGMNVFFLNAIFGGVAHSR